MDRVCSLAYDTYNKYIEWFSQQYLLSWFWKKIKRGLRVFIGKNDLETRIGFEELLSVGFSTIFAFRRRSYRKNIGYHKL